MNYYEALQMYSYKRGNELKEFERKRILINLEC